MHCCSPPAHTPAFPQERENENGQILLHPRVEVTQHEPLPAVELREGLSGFRYLLSIGCRYRWKYFTAQKRAGGVLGESTEGLSSLRQQASEKGEICPTEPTILTSSLICLRRIIFLPFLPSLPSPALEQALAEMISAGCHAAAWPSFIFSCKQKKWLTH